MLNPPSPQEKIKLKIEYKMKQNKIRYPNEGFKKGKVWFIDYLSAYKTWICWSYQTRELSRKICSLKGWFYSLKQLSPRSKKICISDVWIGHFFQTLKYLIKLRFSKKATKFETISHMICRLLSKCQIKWEIVSNFCGLFRMSELYNEFSTLLN